VQLSDGRTTTDLWPVTARVIVVVHIHADATAEVPLEGADAILLDAPPLDGRLGGTGRRFDWTEARAVCAASTVPILVAGGLTPTNVGSAIATLHPWGVDVSSGVESSPGAKDPLQLAAFFQAVAAADANVRGDTESTEAMERAT
jgi:phosphoribosylanthranilate isomerase